MTSVSDAKAGDTTQWVSTIKIVLDMHPYQLLTALALTLGVNAIQAQNVKPGLWESTSKISGSPELERAMAEMKKMMESMPPERRKEMQAMMAKQGAWMSYGEEGTAIRICITKEMSQRSTPPVTDPNCSYSGTPRQGDRQSFSFSCTNPTRSGEGLITYQGDSSYHSVMTMKGDAGSGTTGTMKIEGTSRFLSNDCGAVKPLPVPR